MNSTATIAGHIALVLQKVVKKLPAAKHIHFFIYNLVKDFFVPTFLYSSMKSQNTYQSTISCYRSCCCLCCMA